MAGRIIGEWINGGSRDRDGHRTYKVSFRVQVLAGEGPAAVQVTPGLPLPGSAYILYGEYDAYAYCLPSMEIKPEHDDGEVCTVWIAEFTFSTEPINRCGDTKVEDPLLEPPRISISYSKYREEITSDLLGPVLNSAFEQMRGPNVEFDSNRLSVKIEQNVGSAYLGYILPSQFLDCVNDRALWGIAPRSVKLSSAPAERLYHGQCYVYYKRTLEFEVITPNAEQASLGLGGFDRVAIDEGSKVLKGNWHETLPVWIVDVQEDGITPLDSNNPSNYQRALDRKHNPIRLLLNNGRPYVPEPESYCIYKTLTEASREASQAGGYLLGPYVTVDICDTIRESFDPDVAGIYCTLDSGNVFPGTCTSVNSRTDLRSSFPNADIFGPFTNTIDCENWCLSVGDDGLSHYWAIYVPVTEQGKRIIQKHPGVNLLLLGIPLTF